MNSLPLSWTISNRECKISHTVNKWNINWLALHELKSAKLPFRYSKEFKKSELLIRGCNTKVSNHLDKLGFSKIHFGMEGVLNLNKEYPNKKSLAELEKRALKFGTVKKIEYSLENCRKLEELKKQSTHGSKPQLKNLFQTKFRENNVLFVFINYCDEWLAAILLSKNSNEKIQTELLLRKENSPIGVMETLVKASFHYAKKNYFSDFSLGEVPFIFSQNLISNNGRLLKVFGNIFQFAYNHKGLYNFKNKFNPIWEPLFICSSRKIRLKQIFFIFIYSNFSALVLNRLEYYFKSYLHILTKKG